MMWVEIFVEGVADRTFVECLLRCCIGIENVTVTNLNGKDKLALSKNKFKANRLNGIKNLVIFDADEDYKSALERIRETETKEGITIDGLFLLPNNGSKGALEDLLIEIINKDHSDFFDCFNLYEKCLSADNKYFVPILKTKIFAYLDSLNKNRKVNIANENQRDYSDKYFWNLEVPELKPLIDFLKEHLS